MYIFIFFLNITVFSKMQFPTGLVFKSVIYCRLANFSEVKVTKSQLIWKSFSIVLGYLYVK